MDEANEHGACQHSLRMRSPPSLLDLDTMRLSGETVPNVLISYDAGS